jgi:nucleotide-binding universal stress UspA family protein
VARRYSSTLALATIVGLSIATRSEAAAVGKPIEEMRHTSAQNLDRLLDEMSSSGLRAKAHYLESHDPAVAIVALAEEQRSDLIIMGTYSRHGLSKFILGSCAEDVIRHAACPVLTVGPNSHEPSEADFSFDSIVFATDLGTDAPLQAALALSLAQDSVGKICLCHIIKDQAVPDVKDQRLKFDAAL